MVRLGILVAAGVRHAGVHRKACTAAAVVVACTDLGDSTAAVAARRVRCTGQGLRLKIKITAYPYFTI